jgi:hypothetical protein
MSTNVIVVDAVGGRPSRVPSSAWRRAATAGVIAGLVFVLAGDRGANTAVPAGIDPLEVLNLQVRANAIVVLDSSATMSQTLGGNQLSGDDTSSKLYLAKQVIRNIVQANQNKLSFLFGRYTQPSGVTLDAGVSAGDPAQPAPPIRFAYSTTSTASPSMVGTPLVVDLRSYLVAADESFTFSEGGVDRVGTVSASRYATGTALALAIESAMNTASPGNRYTVTYNGTAGGDHFFEITRSVVGLGFIINPPSKPMNAAFAAKIGFTLPASSNLLGVVTGDKALGDIDLLSTATDTFAESGVSYYRAFSRPYYNGLRVDVLGSGIACAVSAQTPGDNTTANPPYVELQLVTGTCAASSVSGSPVKFVFGGAGDRTAGGSWAGWSAANSCGGFEQLVGLAPCTQSLQLDPIATPFLQPEIRINADGTLDGYTEDANGNLATQPNSAGNRALGFTPIAEALEDIKVAFGTIWTTVSSQTPRPRTFVILVTGGDDSCPTDTTGDTAAAGADARALRAAYRAQLLYDRINAVEPNSSATTYVVALGSVQSQIDHANWVAWAGSGMVKATSGTGDAQQWTTAPTAAERAACTTCQDAFVATNVADLASAVQAAIDQGQASGEFSDQQSITETVFELVRGVPVASPSPGASPVPSPDPLRADNRYNSSVPVLLQSTFEMPGFKGHLKAFRNISGAASPAWDTTIANSDAGQKLATRVATSLGTASYTFDTLRGGATSTDATIVSVATAGVIKRRIYSTNGNGVYTNGLTNAQRVTALQDNSGGPVNYRVAIWPPTTTSTGVDPTGASRSYPAGLFDNALGIGPAPVPPPTGGSAPAALTFAQLQAQFGACTAAATGGTLPTDCSDTTTSGTPAVVVQDQIARKEARQIILAYTAGATLVTSGGSAVRNGAAGCVFNGTTCGALQFVARPWLLAESTLAAPGVVTPPLESVPATHTAEYKLYRDGPRTTAGLAADTGGSILLGFGLRNPDKDGTDLPGTTRMSLKPAMSVVYHATNGMLHAFRAGPCSDASGGTLCLDGVTNEKGGEEMWAFVPFDQLQNLKERIKTQGRDPHAYMLASPVRFADVFVPGDFSRSIGSVTVSGAGVWRTVLVFGRGIAGKYYTALDVTAPGPFTQKSLSAAPPIPLWSRGNPDTVDGLAGGTANNTTGANTDGTQYAKLGQTWAVPAVAFVSAGDNTTARTPGGVEFVAYTGSGYGSGSNAAAEGTTLFTMDLLTGDLITSVDVGDRSGMAYENALVAGPSVFNPTQLRSGFIGTSASSRATRVYFPDIHGRIWRVMTAAPGTALLFADVTGQQPIGNSLALLNYTGTGTQDRPHVFAESGNDNRVTPPPADTPPFHMWGLRDEDLASDPDTADAVTGPARVLFTIDFPNLFRGNVQPATAFNDASPPQGRVFFGGNRFNLPDSQFAPTPQPPCRSSFDAILFAVGAESGNAAYDLNSSGDDRSITLTNQRVQAVRVAGGRLVLDTGLNANTAPPPPAPPIAAAAQPQALADIFFGPQPGASALLAVNPVQYKQGSSVCR